MLGVESIISLSLNYLGKKTERGKQSIKGADERSDIVRDLVFCSIMSKNNRLDKAIVSWLTYFMQSYGDGSLPSDRWMTSFCVYVCLCMCERERGREGGLGGVDWTAGGKWDLGKEWTDRWRFGQSRC